MALISGGARATGRSALGSTFGNVTVLGVKEAIAKLGAVAQAAYRRLGYIAYSGAQTMESEAKVLVPVASGALQGGIRKSKLGLYEWQVTASSGDGGADKEYAGYVEYGTSNMEARPYFRPAASIAAEKMRRELALLAATLGRM